MLMLHFIYFARQMPSVSPPTPTRALPGHTPSYLSDNSTDLVPIACPIIHFNFEFGPSKVILIITIFTEYRHLT